MGMNPRTALDNEAALQQQKVHARQFAATMALELIKAPNYSILAYDVEEVTGVHRNPKAIGGDVNVITLLAMAQEIEKYIMGDLEDELKRAMDAAANKFNAPKIVRP